MGRIKEIPGIFSQGETLEELEENIKDAFTLMTEEDSRNFIHSGSKTKDIILEVA